MVPLYYLLFCGGPIAWLGNQLVRTRRLSVPAKQRFGLGTNEASKLTVSISNVASGMADLGYPITDALSPTDLFNDNEACVKWSHNMTMKATRHMEQRETSVREWVQDKTLKVYTLKVHAIHLISSLRK